MTNKKHLSGQGGKADRNNPFSWTPIGPSAHATQTKTYGSYTPDSRTGRRLKKRELARLEKKKAE